jgi:hypothetical protein
MTRKRKFLIFTINSMFYSSHLLEISYVLFFHFMYSSREHIYFQEKILFRLMKVPFETGFTNCATSHPCVVTVYTARGHSGDTDTHASCCRHLLYCPHHSGNVNPRRAIRNGNEGLLTRCQMDADVGAASQQ